MRYAPKYSSACLGVLAASPSISKEKDSFSKPDILLISLKFLPITNSWLSMCIAVITAFLIGVSPDFDIRSDIKLFGFSDHLEGVLTIFPASKRPHVDAFTKILSA